ARQLLPQGLHKLQASAVPVGAGLPAMRPVQAAQDSFSHNTRDRYEASIRAMRINDEFPYN
ncbi:hypothetical protein, partial [Pseudomonas sp. NPDC089406]|uniref:hypothetical protein n=1 Tax=Pseudomonas sp. NPDC089406 TaxID=3364463 RepID=UPI00384FDFE3